MDLNDVLDYLPQNPGEFYFRDFSLSIPDNSNFYYSGFANLSLSILPIFAAFCDVREFSISTLSNGTRSVTSFFELAKVVKQKGFSNAESIKKLLKTAAAVLALSMTLLNPFMGMLVSSSQDLILETHALTTSFGKNQQTVKSLIGLANKSLYLLGLLHPSSSLMIPLLFSQFCFEISSFDTSFREQHFIRGVIYLNLAVFRTCLHIFLIGIDSSLNSPSSSTRMLV